MASAFSPQCLKTVRAEYVAAGLCRRTVSKLTDLVKRVWRWSVSEGLVPVEVYSALQTVEGLRRGRTDVPDHPDVQPVPEAMIQAVQPFVSAQVWAMIQLQMLSGAARDALAEALGSLPAMATTGREGYAG